MNEKYERLWGELFNIFKKKEKEKSLLAQSQPQFA